MQSLWLMREVLYCVRDAVLCEGRGLCGPSGGFHVAPCGTMWPHVAPCGPMWHICCEDTLGKNYKPEEAYPHWGMWEHIHITHNHSLGYEYMLHVASTHKQGHAVMHI